MNDAKGAIRASRFTSAPLHLGGSGRVGGGVCVCVFMKKRERKRGKQKEKERGPKGNYWLHSSHLEGMDCVSFDRTVVLHLGQFHPTPILPLGTSVNVWRHFFVC